MRRPKLTFRALGTGLLLVLASLVFLPAAQADTTLLCKGFTDCAKRGYVNYGYAAEYRQMHWRMYGGHNCTNYAAFRIIQMGGPKERPWSGGGNASNWGIELASKTNSTPSVGAVAWWRSRNHVQIVEKVIDANTIVVSEDHWGGDFNWAIVRRGNGSNWPTGFIHIVDRTLAPTAKPTVPAQAQVGAPIVANPGTWPAGTTVSYQWLAAASPGSAGGYPIPGATFSTYFPRPADAGKWLMFRVIAEKPGYRPGKAYSQKTQPVALGRMQVSGETTISGFPKVGGTLEATAPTFSPTPDSIRYQWFADGQPVQGANEQKFVPGPAHLGKRISVGAAASSAGYHPQGVRSAQTPALLPAEMRLTREVRLGGSSQYGGTLTVETGAASLPDAQMKFGWYRDGVLVTTAPRPYPIGPADIGRRITAKVVWSRPGYDDIVRERSTATIRVRPELRILSKDDRALRISMSAPGDPRIFGRIHLRAANGRTYHAWVQNGLARFKELPVGPMSGVISYDGNRNALARNWKVTLTIRD